MKVAAKGLRDIAERKVAAFLREQHKGDHLASDRVVKIVFDVLEEPDRAMIAAGAVELDRAMPPGVEPAYTRNLTRVIWRQMFAAAR